MIEQRPSRQEIVARGKQIYDERLRQEAERDHSGNFVTIDVLSGDYAIAPTDSEAAQTLLLRRPNAILFGVRIGEVAAYRFGHSKTELR